MTAGRSGGGQPDFQLPRLLGGHQCLHDVSFLAGRNRDGGRLGGHPPRRPPRHSTYRKRLLLSSAWQNAASARASGERGGSGAFSPFFFGGATGSADCCLRNASLTL